MRQRRWRRSGEGTTCSCDVVVVVAGWCMERVSVTASAGDRCRPSVQAAMQAAPFARTQHACCPGANDLALQAARLAAGWLLAAPPPHECGHGPADGEVHEVLHSSQEEHQVGKLWQGQGKCYMSRFLLPVSTAHEGGRHAGCSMQQVAGALWPPCSGRVERGSWRGSWRGSASAGVVSTGRASCIVLILHESATGDNLTSLHA